MRWTDFAATLGVPYAAVTLAGTVAMPLRPELAARVGALLAVALMVGLYAVATAPGRRSSWPAYLFAGFICPLAVTLLGVLAFYLPLSYRAFTIAEALLAGFGVGARVTGSTDPAWGATVLMGTFLLWWLGIAVAVVVPVALRDLLNKYRAR